jgi:hypothetical protein
MSMGAISTRDILIQTEDIEAATAFYETVLGLGVFMREPAMVGLESARSGYFSTKPNRTDRCWNSRSTISKPPKRGWSRPDAGSRMRTRQCRAAMFTIPMA